MNMYLSLKETLEANSPEHKLGAQIKAALDANENANTMNESLQISPIKLPNGPKGLMQYYADEVDAFNVLVDKTISSQPIIAILKECINKCESFKNVCPELKKEITKCISHLNISYTFAKQFYNWGVQQLEARKRFPAFIDFIFKFANEIVKKYPDLFVDIDTDLLWLSSYNNPKLALDVAKVNEDVYNTIDEVAKKFGGEARYSKDNEYVFVNLKK